MAKTCVFEDAIAGKYKFEGSIPSLDRVRQLAEEAERHAVAGGDSIRRGLRKAAQLASKSGWFYGIGSRGLLNRSHGKRGKKKKLRRAKKR